MKKKNKKIILTTAIILAIVIVVVFVFWNSDRVKRNRCIRRCYYSRIYGGQMVWKIRDSGRNDIFKTREECIDFCKVYK